jgi:hypothetical protein
MDESIPVPGTVNLFGLPDPDLKLYVRIQILPSKTKK